MNIIIIGCGKVGSALAEQLSREGHDITVIDERNEAVNHVTGLSDVQGLCGNGASYSVQKEAGITKADLMIAVTGADEVNLFCCLIAKKAGNCQTIARVRNPVYYNEISFIKEELGLSMIINPEWAVAQEMAKLLQFPSAIDIDTFAKGRIELLRFKIKKDSPLCNKMIKDATTITKYAVLVCIVERKNDVLIPNGLFELKENDIVSVVISSVNANKFFKLINIESDQVKNTLIIGGGKISYYLAQRLLEMKIDVKVIEKDMEKANNFSQLLPKATVILGDGTEHSILEEEGINQTEGFVALTDIDEENVMLSLYAQSVSKAKTITKVSNTTYDAIIDSLNVGSVIYPRNITTEYILQYVRAMQNSFGSNVETLYRLVEGRAEALEFFIREKGAVVSRPLQELKLKKNLLVCAIYRNNTIIIPKGQDRIEVGDSVVIITTTTGLKDINDILE